MVLIVFSCFIVIVYYYVALVQIPNFLLDRKFLMHTPRRETEKLCEAVFIRNWLFPQWMHLNQTSMHLLLRNVRDSFPQLSRSRQGTPEKIAEPN